MHMGQTLPRNIQHDCVQRIDPTLNKTYRKKRINMKHGHAQRLHLLSRDNQVITDCVDRPGNTVTDHKVMYNGLHRPSLRAVVVTDNLFLLGGVERVDGRCPVDAGGVNDGGGELALFQLLGMLLQHVLRGRRKRRREEGREEGREEEGREKEGRGGGQGEEGR